jgi:hypothetical protein
VKDRLAPLVFALIAAAAARDDEGREALLEEIQDLDAAYDVITGLASAAGGLLIGASGSKEKTLDLLRDFVFEVATRDGDQG